MLIQQEQSQQISQLNENKAEDEMDYLACIIFGACFGVTLMCLLQINRYDD